MRGAAAWRGSQRTSGSGGRVGTPCDTSSERPGFRKDPGLFLFIFAAGMAPARRLPRSPGLRPTPASPAVASFVNKSPRRRLRFWPVSCAAHRGCSSVEERHLARVEAAGSKPAIRSTSGVPLRHRRRAAEGTARRACARGRSPCAARAPGRHAGRSRRGTAEVETRRPSCPGGSACLKSRRARFDASGLHHHFRVRRNTCRASSMDQSTALRRRGLYVRVVRAAPDHPDGWQRGQCGGLQIRCLRGTVGSNPAPSSIDRMVSMAQRQRTGM